MKKKRKLGFFIVLGLNFLIMAFLVFSILQLAVRMERIVRMNIVLANIVRIMGVNQVEMIDHMKVFAGLTGIDNTADKAAKGWYEALEENIAREIPLVYPEGWADRYFNFMARTGAIGKLHETRRAEGEARGGNAE